MTTNGDNPGVKRLVVPTLTITFDPRTFGVEVGGSVPSWEFAKAMLQMASDEADKQIRKRDTQRGVALAGPELLDALKRGA